MNAIYFWRVERDICSPPHWVTVERRPSSRGMIHAFRRSNHVKFHTGDEVSRELKSLTLATQWRRAGPLHPTLPQKHKSPAEAGV